MIPVVVFALTLGMTLWADGTLSFAEPGQLRENIKEIPGKDASFAQKALAKRYFRLGVELAKEGKWGGAAVEYFRAIGEDDTLAEAHTNLGVALAQQGKTERGIPHHVRAIELNPKLAQAHVNLAVDLAHIGRYSDAWASVHAAQDLGHTVHPEFLKLLASRLLDPRQK